jgi:ATP-binding cassette subfamily B protein
MNRERPTGSTPESFAELRARDLSFSYPAAQNLALDTVNTTIRAGQVVAVVGENGSGKTTLAKILAHLYTPTSGALYWDGTDARTCDSKRLRSKVAVVFQDFSLFEVPLRDNIGFGDVEHVDDLVRVRRAAAEIGIDRMADSLPSGYDTVISPRMGDGIDLSGGQRQRVALARAFFREPLLLVLDEPTSALDAKAEKRLFDQIQAMAADRTVVFVSHRFTSVLAADHIIVLQRGRVAEQGTHAQLMANRGHYYDLFSLQAAAYLDLKAADADAV